MIQKQSEISCLTQSRISQKLVKHTQTLGDNFDTVVNLELVRQPKPLSNRVFSKSSASDRQWPVSRKEDPEWKIKNALAFEGHLLLRQSWQGINCPMDDNGDFAEKIDHLHALCQWKMGVWTVLQIFQTTPPKAWRLLVEISQDLVHHIPFPGIPFHHISVYHIPWYHAYNTMTYWILVVKVQCCSYNHHSSVPVVWVGANTAISGPGSPFELEYALPMLGEWDDIQTYSIHFHFSTSCFLDFFQQFT